MIFFHFLLNEILNNASESGLAFSKYNVRSSFKTGLICSSFVIQVTSLTFSLHTTTESSTSLSISMSRLKKRTPRGEGKLRKFSSYDRYS